MTTSIEHFILVLILSFTITFIEIFSEYPKECSIAYKSKHFLHLLVFNVTIAVSLFLVNVFEIFKIFDTSNPWKLVFITGLSGFFFFNSKLDIQKIELNNLSSIKSYISKMKFKIYNLMNEYIKRGYPDDLMIDIQNDFNYKKIEDFLSFADISYRTLNIAKTEGIDSDEIKNISNISDAEKVHFFVRAFLEVKGPAWVKHRVLDKFCLKNTKK